MVLPVECIDRLLFTSCRIRNKNKQKLGLCLQSTGFRNCSISTQFSVDSKVRWSQPSFRVEYRAHVLTKWPNTCHWSCHSTPVRIQTFWLSKSNNVGESYWRTEQEQPNHNAQKNKLRIRKYSLELFTYRSGWRFPCNITVWAGMFLFGLIVCCSLLLNIMWGYQEWRHTAYMCYKAWGDQHCSTPPIHVQ